MSLAVIALLFAFGAAGWLLLRFAANQEGGSSRSMSILKVVVWLALSAALLAAKLWPLAFMVLIAAGGVTAIETWGRRAAKDEISEDQPKPPPSLARMSVEEAYELLGLQADAKAEGVRSAHRKLISQLHPDKGGTDYLAAKINEARDILLRHIGDDA